MKIRICLCIAIILSVFTFSDALAGTHGAVSSYEENGQPQSKQEGSKVGAGNITSNIRDGMGGGSDTQTTSLDANPFAFNQNVKEKQNVSLFRFGAGDGKSAGSADRRAGVWLNLSSTWIDKNDIGTTSDFDGSVLNVTGGADYRVTDKFLLGLSLGYENQDINTIGGAGNLDADGFTVAPYFGFRINDRLSVDGSAGYTSVDIDTDRNHGLITGNTEGDRFFGTANLNYILLNKDGWNVGGKVGYLYVLEDQDAYTESNGTNIVAADIRSGQFRGGLNATYTARTSVGYTQLYGNVRFEYDNVHNAASQINAAGDMTANDRFGTTFGLGVRVGVGDNFNINLKGETTKFRENLDSYNLSGTARYLLKF